MTEDERPSEGEIYRFARGEEVRVYKLRVVARGTELWRITLRPGQPDAAIKEDDFNDIDVAVRCFEEIERTLIAGRWRKISE